VAGEERNRLGHGLHEFAAEEDTTFFAPILLAKLKQLLNPIGTYRPRFEQLTRPAPLHVAPLIPIQKTLEAAHWWMIGVGRNEDVANTALKTMRRQWHLKTPYLVPT
jgi:hypothetical protein